MTKKWTPEQQKAHRALWVESLRSGEYKQATYMLRNEDGSFCCLGVACDLWLKSGDAPKGAKWVGDGIIQFKARPNANKDWNSYRKYGDLPTVVKEWLGLSNDTGSYFLKDGKETNLVNQNDIDGKSFKQIAQIIEREPKGLIAE